MKEPAFSGPATNKAVQQAISRDLDDLGFVVGKEFIYGPRCSGRTTGLLREALHQLDFMDPGDDIWVVTCRIQEAKHLCEHVGNYLAEEMGFELTPTAPLLRHPIIGQGPACRYFLTFKENKHIHFCTVDELPAQLRGRRLTYSPCIFFEHLCYEFGVIEDSLHDLYSILRDVA